MWKIEFRPRALKELKKLDREAQARVTSYLHERIATNPTASGEALTGTLKGLWRYRTGDYRIIVDIQKETITVCVVRVGHRKDVYDF